MKFKYLFPCLLLPLLLLSGCKIAILQPAGPIAAAEKELLITVVLLMLIVVLPVIFLTIGISIRYRASNKKATYWPNWSHNLWLEVIWWSVPIIIICVLATLTWITSHNLDPFRPLKSNKPPLIIQAIALEWRWLFIYPNQNIAAVDFVELPVNQPIQFLITADAPMNSFQIPQLGSQIYAMAGMQTQVHLLATQTGDFLGGSMNFSGPGFANMRFTARVTSSDQFAAWIAHIKTMPTLQPLTIPAYEKLALPHESDQILYFSPIAPNLFDYVIMKFMMPIHAMGEK